MNIETYPDGRPQRLSFELQPYSMTRGYSVGLGRMAAAAKLALPHDAWVTVEGDMITAHVVIEGADPDDLRDLADAIQAAFTAHLERLDQLHEDLGILRRAFPTETEGR